MVMIAMIVALSTRVMKMVTIWFQKKTPAANIIAGRGINHHMSRMLFKMCQSRHNLRLRGA